MSSGASSLLEQQVFQILKQTFGPENALLLMEYWSQRMPLDVARRRDLGEIRLEIEKVRAELAKEIERVRAELTKEIERVRAELTRELEKLRVELELVRAEGQTERERIRADLLKWSFVFWATQMLAIGGVLFSLVQLTRALP